MAVPPIPLSCSCTKASTSQGLQTTHARCDSAAFSGPTTTQGARYALLTTARVHRSRRRTAVHPQAGHSRHQAVAASRTPVPEPRLWPTSIHSTSPPSASSRPSTSRGHETTYGERATSLRRSSLRHIAYDKRREEDPASGGRPLSC